MCTQKFGIANWNEEYARKCVLHGYCTKLHASARCKDMRHYHPMTRVLDCTSENSKNSKTCKWQSSATHLHFLAVKPRSSTSPLLKCILARTVALCRGHAREPTCHRCKHEKQRTAKEFDRALIYGTFRHRLSIADSERTPGRARICCNVRL